MSDPVIAGIQITSTEDVDANLQAADQGLQRAAEQGASLAVLPENFAVYGQDYRSVAEQRGVELVAWLRDRARSLGLAIIGGTIPLIDRGPDSDEVPAPRVRAASLAVNEQGETVARYDKLHLFDAEVADQQGRYCESDVFEPGDHVQLAELAGVSVGMAVCYDLRFPALSRALADRGARLLVYPSAFTRVTGEAHWEILLRARAVETGCYVLGVGQTGRHSPRRETHGHSMLVDPWGRVEARLEDAPGVVTGVLDLARQDEIRHRLPVHKHQRFGVQFPDDIISG
jgi:predicted amidohydrolase